jgi:ribosomal protein S18 acetylase RimI-like enzyme
MKQQTEGYKAMLIRPYSARDETSVIALWTRCDLVRPWNDPKLDIGRKAKIQPDLFLVGVLDEKVVATAMGGYEGHRGWVNYLAVSPDFQRQGLGRKMMEELESKFIELGCPKINLQVRMGNGSALIFYGKIGYKEDRVVSLGKRLIKDD